MFGVCRFSRFHKRTLRRYLSSILNFATWLCQLNGDESCRGSDILLESSHTNAFRWSWTHSFHLVHILSISRPDPKVWGFGQYLTMSTYYVLWVVHHFLPIDKWPKGEIDDLWSTDECNGCLTHCPVWLVGVVCGDWKLYPSAPWFSHQIICLPWQLDWNSLHRGAQKVRFSIRKAAFCLRHDARYDLTPWEMNLITNILATIHFEYFMRWPEIWQ